MATSTESETKPKLSEALLEAYKGKEVCPRCQGKYLYTNDSDKFDEIVNYVCMGCGHVFYEDEQGRKRRHEKTKGDKRRNPWDSGLLLLLTMLAVILAINLDRNRLERNGEPVTVSPSVKVGFLG
ncbi:MAG: hypothetical protein AAF703_10480 [Cyanobacteria bacterium P01_D01_bin.105]